MIQKGKMSHGGQKKSHVLYEWPLELLKKTCSGSEVVTLASSPQRGDSFSGLRESESSGIWQSVTSIVPSLAKAELICESVGIRADR